MLQQKNLKIYKTYTTPSVVFDTRGELLIEGRSIPVDAHVFFSQLEDWINDYVWRPAESTTLMVNFEYSNKLSLKLLYRLISKLTVSCPNFKVEWNFEEGDEDMLELGEILSSVSNCRFSFNEVVAA